jgi:hypothetical protein
MNGFYLNNGKGGLNLGQYQEFFLRPSLKTLQGRYPVLTFVNTRGRLVIKAVLPVSEAGPRRMGIQI